MSPAKERDPSLPAIPENKEAKLRSSSWDDEDAEEQGLFERDNRAANTEAGKAASESESPTHPLSNDGDDDDDIRENGDGDGKGTRADAGPFYVRSAAGDSWELTWPIWHMLPRNERRAIAAQHGMKSIGEFEEYMSLSRAVDESDGGAAADNNGTASRSGGIVLVNDNDGSDDRGLAVDASGVGGLSEVSNDSTGVHWQPPFIGGIEEDDSSISSSEEEDPTVPKESDNDADELDLEKHLEMLELGGLPCLVPDEILHKCFAFLPVDDYATLALVSPHWSRFTRCESLYKILCQRIYLNQSKRKTLQISRFGNSYRKMLEQRPRVRTGGGVYVLKYQEVRKVERDMWTGVDIPLGAVWESVYYRYLYFFEDGRVMYALTHASPVEMIPRFHKMLVHGTNVKDKWGVWGRYEIRKDVVRVWASQAWQDVCFQMKVIPSNKDSYYTRGDRGVCTTMMLEKHLSSPSGNFEDDSYDLVDYEVPDVCYFRYLRDRRL